IGHVEHAAITAAFGLQSRHATTIQTQPDRLVYRFALQQRLYEDRPQAFHIDASILQRFVDAGPASLEEDRERQFGQTACLRLAHERVAQVEQRIGTAFKAVIHLLTHLLPCVKVHLSNAPFDVLPEHYSFRQASARGLTFWPPIVYLSFAQISDMVIETR